MTTKLRLHKAISNNLLENQDFSYTSPEIHKNITSSGVCVDGAMVFNRLLWVYDFQKLDINHWPKRKLGDISKIQVLLDTNNWLLLYKPSGVPMQHGNGHVGDTVVDWLNNYYQPVSSLNLQKIQFLDSNSKSEFLLVHRLDKDTCGLVLVAKNQPTLDFFQDQFRNRQVTKKYLALVNGLVEQTIWIKNYQARDTHNPLRQKFFWDKTEASNYSSHFRLSKSVIKPLFICRETNQTLVEVSILTGRMHQIRLQCEALGFGLVNDSIYNNLSPNFEQVLASHHTTLSTKILDFDTFFKKEDDANLHTFFTYPNKIQNLTLDQMENLKSDLFDNTSYYLLSFYLKLRCENNFLLQANFVDKSYILTTSK